MQLQTRLSTSGGTSDGRFIAPRGVEVVELGPCNATIHKVDEQVSVASLHTLSDIYQGHPDPPADMNRLIWVVHRPGDLPGFYFHHGARQPGSIHGSGQPGSHSGP